MTAAARPAPVRSRVMKRASRALASALTVLSLLAPACRRQSDEDAVAAVLEAMAGRVEARDAAGLVEHLAADYADFEERDREATRRLAEEHFRRFRGIKAKLLSTRVTPGGEGSATAEVDVALYSGLASALRQAAGFPGENYRVSCELRRRGRWLVIAARWEYVPVSGLFPESLKALQELFPGA
jgi:ketosteroid isomerase-like protein